MAPPDENTDRLTDRAADRQGAILDASFHAFATYGFRRTTMDDIAAGAGISRSALYLHYRNKEDIFRSLTQRFFAGAAEDVAAALAESGPALEQTLLAAFVAKDGKFMEVVLGSAHGAELLDAGFSVSAELAAAGEARITDLFAAFIATRGVADDLGTPLDVAGTIMAALKGLKLSAHNLNDYRTGQARLARLFARAMTA